MPVLSRTNNSRIYVFGLMLMAIALPSSNLLMSLAQAFIAANWFLEGDFKIKLTRFFSNKGALVFTSIYLMHLLGLLYTSDYDYAVVDLRNKVPWLVIPLLIASSEPLSKQQIGQVFKVFTLSVHGMCP